jgi:hypothetical protein
MPAVSKSHWNLKNLIGKRFGLLSVISEAGRNQKRSAIWLCQCDCGKQVTRIGSTLLAGKSSSCGCRWHSPESRAKIAQSQIRPGSLMRREYRHYRDGAIARGHQWGLSESQFKDLVQMSCRYCGTEPSIERNTKYEQDLFNGIDRVDNTKGYEMDNCVPCCKICNYMKRALSVEEFMAHIHLIATHIKESENASCQ